MVTGRRAGLGPALLRVVLAAISTAALLAGVPVALLVFVGNPLPTVLPSWDEVTHALSTGRIDPWTQIKALAIVAWLAWANLAFSFVVEALAAVRGGRARSVRPLAATQWLAARLVGHLAIAGSLMLNSSASMAGAVLPPLPSVAAAAPAPSSAAMAPDPDLDLDLDLDPDHGSSSAPGSAPVAEITTKRLDTLWSLAEAHLGAGEQWPALRDANVGRVMPDGTRLAPGFTRVEKGWSLLMPATAAGVDVDAAVHVDAGDNLWDLSEAQLRQADRPSAPVDVLGYLHDVIDRNDDMIDDPDLIYPGQVFAFPAPENKPSDDGPDNKESDRGPGAEGIVDQHDQAAPSAPVVGHEPGSTEPAPIPGQGQEPESEAAGREREESEAAPVTDGDGFDLQLGLIHAGSVSLGAGGALLAAGALRHLRRRRRYRLAHRSPGRLPAPPEAELNQIERALNRQGDPETAEWIWAALASLAARPVWPGESIAHPLSATFHGDYLEVVFEPPDAMAAPLPWVSPDQGHSWHLPRLTSVEDLPSVGTVRPVPTLVTVGVDRLLNLEAVGLLSVTGRGQAPYDLVRSLVHELATSPAAGVIDVRSSVTLAGTEAYGLVRYQEPRAIQTELLAWLDGVEDGLERAEATNAYALRLIDDDDPLGPVVVVVAAEDLDQLDLLRRRAETARLPLALIVIGAVETPNVIEVDAQEATLSAVDATFEPQLLDEEAAAALGRLLADAASAPEQPVVAGVELSGSALLAATRRPSSSPSSSPPRPATSDERDPGMAPVPRPVEALRAEDELLAERPEPAIVVRVLGQVAVEGVAQELTSQQLSILGYLACHGPVSRAMLIDALWDGQIISQSRLPNLLTELRARVGRQHLPEARDGRYELDGVGTDLAQFERGVRASHGLEPAAAVAVLRPILALVRGVPFTPPSRRFWSWVSDESHLAAHVEAVVADTALRLAGLERGLGHNEEAQWACQQGLLASPTDESLVTALTELYVEQGKSGLARRLVEGWEDRISRLECGEPSDGPRRRLAG